MTTVHPSSARHRRLSTAAIPDSQAPHYAGLGDRQRRASLSIPLNIAEGSEKSSDPGQRRFYAIARGSAMEYAAILDACTALALIEPPRAEELNQLLP